MDHNDRITQVLMKYVLPIIITLIVLILCADYYYSYQNKCEECEARIHNSHSYCTEHRCKEDDCENRQGENTNGYCEGHYKAGAK